MFHLNAPGLFVLQSKHSFAARDLLLALLSVFTIALLPGSAFAQQGTLTDDVVYPPPQGAPSGSGQKPTAPSNAPTLQVQGPNARRGPAVAYIKFRLAGGASNQIGDLPAGTPGSHVQKATLRLYVNEVTTPGAFDVYGVTSSWNENNLTTAPQVEAVPIATEVQVRRADSYIAVEITPLVQKWLDYDPNNPGAGGLPNYGLALLASASAPDTAVSFDSKENTETSHQAQLSVVLKHVAEADHATRADHADTASSASYATNAGTANALAANATVAASQITGTVTPTNGGTGLTSSGAAGNFLRSDGSKWVSAPLPASDLPGGSNNYIQNTTTQQSGNFNISGDGTVGGNLSANTVTASAQYNIGSNRVLSTTATESLFVGLGAGRNNTTGFSNSFVGFNAGQVNTAGKNNSFIGWGAGNSNTTGSENSFVGTSAGRLNTTGSSNSFFGLNAGHNVTTGSNNSFFGAWVGQFSGGGSGNSFFGSYAGQYSNGGSNNVFVGFNSGASNTNESNNTFIGAGSNGFAGITNATAVGAGAVVTQSNSVVLGNNASVGIGTSAPQAKLHVAGGSLLVTGNSDHGVVGRSTINAGVHGTSNSGDGIYGTSTSGYGARGHSNDNAGIYGNGKVGVQGSGINYGVWGETGSGYAIYGKNTSDSGWAGYFDGPVNITKGCAGCTAAPSDRNLKVSFGAVNGRAILDRLAAVSIQTWHYKSDPSSLRHIGPMAQDFKAAFAVGKDDKHIDLIDTNGVALAAIQALHQMMQEKDKQIAHLTKEVEALKAQRTRAKHKTGHNRR